MNPAFEYFKSKFDPSRGELRETLLAFKASRYFAPNQLNELRPSPTEVDRLKSFPFLSHQLIEEMKCELPAYLSLAEDVSADVNVTSWWKDHEQDIPSWGEASKLMLLVQPSSAAAERVFSLLENSFSKQQTRSLEDYVSLSVMLQYNNY